MSKQFRLTVPEAEADGIIKKAKAEKFDTPQKLILYRLRRYDALRAEIKALEKKYEDIETLTTEWVLTDEVINEVAITKTQEVLEVVKSERHELLMLYAFRYIFPEVPAGIVAVMTEYELTPGVYYMQHVCEKFPGYVKQIKTAAKRATQAEADNANLKGAVNTLTTQRDTFETQLNESVDKAARIEKEKAEQLKPIASHLGVPDTVEHIVDGICEIETEAENLQGLQEQLNAKSETIAKIAEQREQLTYDRDFYKNQSWWRKLWESITGRISKPPQIPRKVDDDEIPF